MSNVGAFYSRSSDCDRSALRQDGLQAAVCGDSGKARAVTCHSLAAAPLPNPFYISRKHVSLEDRSDTPGAGRGVGVAPISPRHHQLLR